MALSMIRKSRKTEPPREQKAEDVEVRLLLEGIFQFYGYDFRQYEPSRLQALILSRLKAEGLDNLSQYQHRILRDRACLDRLIESVTANRRGMFDPPGLWKLLRERIVPVLRTYPTSKVWVPGCSSGEEAYSLAVLLQEEGLGHRSVVYATELDEGVIARARQGRLSAVQFAQARKNYRRSGGRSPLRQYGSETDQGFSFNGALSGRIVFATHSLATDSSFNEFNLILCRNLLSRFSPVLQGRARALLHQSLGMFGYLSLGARESMRDSSFIGCYEAFNRKHHLYRRIR
jgi:chemotaxis protein methyltransferase CheR